MGYLLTYQNWFLSWSTLFLRKGWVLTASLTWPYSLIIVRSVFLMCCYVLLRRLWYVLSLAGPLVVMHTGSSVNRMRHISNVLWLRYLCIALCIIPNCYFDLLCVTVLTYFVCFCNFSLLKGFWTAIREFKKQPAGEQQVLFSFSLSIWLVIQQ